MADFPTSITSLDNPTSAEYLGTAAGIGIADIMSNANDEIEALETKVGVDSSAVATSIDYLLKSSSSSNPGHKHTISSLTSIVDLTTAQTLTNKTLTAPIISTISNTGTITLPTATDTLVGKATTDILTNKRITKRITTISSEGTPTINTDNCDCVTITAQAEAITSMTTNLTGTPTNFQTLIIRIKDNGTARAITWGASFEAKGIVLPTTTVISKVLTVGFIYDTVTSKWGCVAVASEA